MAVHPLRSATHRRLGGPLPRQPANAPRAPLSVGPLPLSWQEDASPPPYPALAPVSRRYSSLKGRLPTCYSPVRRSSFRCKHRKNPLDLHVLGTPPAFVLSQDQTLKSVPLSAPSRKGAPLYLQTELWLGCACLVFKEPISDPPGMSPSASFAPRKGLIASALSKRHLLTYHTLTMKSIESFSLTSS